VLYVTAFIKAQVSFFHKLIRMIVVYFFTLLTNQMTFLNLSTLPHFLCLLNFTFQEWSAVPRNCFTRIFLPRACFHCPQKIEPITKNVPSHIVWNGPTNISSGIILSQILTLYWTLILNQYSELDLSF
jgi:hypothetical protein